MQNSTLLVQFMVKASVKNTLGLMQRGSLLLVQFVSDSFEKKKGGRIQADKPFSCLWQMFKSKCTFEDNEVSQETNF